MFNTISQQRLEEVLQPIYQNHDFLFQRYGFTVIYEALTGRYQSEPIIGLGNGKVQLLFYSYYGAPDLSFYGASYSAVPDLQYYRKYWFPSPLIYLYLTDRVTTAAWRKQNFDLLQTQTWHFIEGKMAEIEPIFATMKTMKRWLPNYIQFLSASEVPVLAPTLEWLND
ncbi:MAG: hypothetical protein KDD73_14720 [Anaerolineales bacterium]|nr:hypothetical protein [Anaerolineales bacterium]MCB9127358.1 hypothetical protein [Ardenticatenales bacterium]MCB9172693.1 hypothetical protein [Ardenticatenales bacterium]